MTRCLNFRKFTFAERFDELQLLNRELVFEIHQVFYVLLEYLTDILMGCGLVPLIIALN